jgi:hypothetical protein
MSWSIQPQSKFLNIAPDSRLSIYEDLFRGFTVHGSPHTVVTQLRYPGAGPMSRGAIIESDVNPSILLTCKQLHAEAQMIFDQSIRFSITWDMNLRDMGEVAYSKGFAKRIIWLSIAEAHWYNLSRSMLPNLKRLGIEDENETSPSKLVLLVKRQAHDTEARFERATKEVVIDRYARRRHDDWQRRFLKALRGRAQVTHYFTYHLHVGKSDMAKRKYIVGILLPLTDALTDIATQTIGFHLETLKTVYRRIELATGEATEYTYNRQGEESVFSVKSTPVIDLTADEA